MPHYLYNAPADPLSPSSYSSTTGLPSCEDGPRLCAIYAEDQSGFPILTSGLKDEIITATVSQNGTNNVYMRAASGEL